MRLGRVSCGWVFALCLAPRVGGAQTRLQVRVARLDGAVDTRGLRRALDPQSLSQCQSTWLGATLVLRVRIASAGHLHIENVRRHGEGGAPYVPCVRRIVERTRLAPSAADALAEVTVLFPPLGIAPTP